MPKRLRRVSLYFPAPAHIPVTHTTYLGLVGETHAFHPTEARTIDDFSDGVTHTGVVIEVLPSDAVHWMSPDDTDGDYLIGLTEESQTSHSGGGYVLFADGAVHFVSQETPLDELRGLSTIAGCRCRIVV